MSHLCIVCSMLTSICDCTTINRVCYVISRSRRAMHNVVIPLKCFDNHSQTHMSQYDLPGSISSIAIAACAIAIVFAVPADAAIAKRMGPGYFPAWIAWSTRRAPGNSLITWRPLRTPIIPLTFQIIVFFCWAINLKR